MNTLARTLFIASFFIMFFFPSALAASTTNEDVFAACKDAPSSPVCQGRNQNTNPIYPVIRVAAGIVASLTGIAVVIVIIISGFTLITSGGNPEAVKKSRSRLFAALIGLVIVAMSWVIISYVIGQLVKT